VTPGAVIVLGSGTYASRWTSTGVKRAEGDFTIDSATWTEWADVIVDQVEAFPDARVWWWCQAHQLGDGSDQNHLSYPTAREIRKMVWEAIGAGAKGLIWFIYQDTEDWDGLAHPNSRSRLQALAEMNARIDRGIRQRLLRCAPASALFSASGGGSAAWAHETYANAGVRTLHDAGTGTYYCVAVNRSTSTASVTLSGVGVSGSLVDLETGASTDLGSAVSLPALDGAIYRFVPSDAYGVPHHMPNASLTTEQWWATHWANPDSVNYVAYGDIETHPNAIDVDASDDLQAIVDGAPDDTTFRLGPGNHGKVYAVGRSGLHFVAADPMDRPTMNAAYIHASVLNADYESFVDAVVNDDDADAIALYLDPPRDFLFRDIDFVPVTGELAGLDAFAECFNFACIADVCIEGCTFGGYRWVDNTGGAVGPIKSGAHGGYVTGTAGVHNVVVRNCEATPVTYAGQSFRAWAVFAYFDGAAGCVIADNTINGSTGFNGGFALFLTNDDFAPSTATAYDGVAGYDEISGEIPHARYNAVFRNTGGPSAFRVDYGGRNLLMAENAANVGANVAKVVSLDARDPSHSVGLTGYLQYDSVIRDNAYTGGNVTGRFVEHLFENNSLGQSEYGRGSRVGRTTITGNSVGGTCAKWYETVDTSTAQDAVATTPITATNNTDSGGSRDGV
jgi:hypothetical protein